MPRTNQFLTRTQVALSIPFVIILGVVTWLASCHVSATTVDMVTPTTVPARSVFLTTITPSPISSTVSSNLPPMSRPACGPATLATATEVIIGGLAPLSKPGAMQNGFAMQAAFNLAVEEVNTQGGIGGKPLRLVAYDTAGLPEQGARSAERLILQDCAVALVGVYHSQVATAVKEVVHRLGVPIIFVDPYADEITTDQFPEVFRIAPTTSMLAQMPGQWLAEVGDYNQDGEKFVTVVADDSNYGSARVNNAETWFPQAGFTVEPVVVSAPATDYNAVIARIVALDHMPDALFLYLPGEAALDLAQALITAGIGPQKQTLLVANPTATDDQVFWAHVPDGVYTIMPHIGPWPSATTAKGQRFAEQYRTYFDRWPEAYAFTAYDAVLLVADAISRTQSLDSAAIIRALEQSDIELAAGHYTFPYNSQNPPDGTMVPAYMWHQWPNPPFYFLQYTEPQQLSSNAAIIWPRSQRTSPGPVVQPSE